MKVLVTGGAGYIGSNVALNLLDRGYEVTIIDDLSTGNLNLIPQKAEFIKCNINETNKIKSIIKKNTFDPKNNFFSARRSIQNKENDYGRNISVIMIN